MKNIVQNFKQYLPVSNRKLQVFEQFLEDRAEQREHILVEALFVAIAKADERVYEEVMKAINGPDPVPTP